MVINGHWIIDCQMLMFEALQKVPRFEAKAKTKKLRGMNVRSVGFCKMCMVLSCSVSSSFWASHGNLLECC